MSSFINVIMVISQLLPLVSGLVQSIETAFPQTAGTLKLQVLQSTLQSAFNHLGSAGVTFEQVWPVLNGFINSAVALYHASGLFTHAGAAIDTAAQKISEVGNTIQNVASYTTQAMTPVSALSSECVANVENAPITSGGGAGPFSLAASGLSGGNS